MSFALALALATASPAGQSCQSALGPLYDGTPEEALPGRVEGDSIVGSEALKELRRRRGDALITVVGGSFRGADFRGAALHNICFLDTNFEGSDWRGADAPGVGFIRANLTGATLAGAKMPGIMLRQPTLANVDALEVDWSGGKLDGSADGNLENLRLDRANLSRFTFDCGITIGDSCPYSDAISLRGADLAGAAVDTFNGGGSIWRGARFNRTTVSLRQLRDIGSSELFGPVIVRGGDARAELSRDEVLALQPHISSPGSGAATPSFDCARASTPIERMICSEDGGTLRAIDRDVAALYRRALAADPGVAASQQAWLRRRDAECAPRGQVDFSCLYDSYDARKGELVARLGPPAWLRPGVQALFVAPSVTFDEAVRETPLYRRLLPVVIGSASSRVYVRVGADGRIDAEGDAIGGNAHMCSLSGRGFTFDRRTGWHSGPAGGENGRAPTGAPLVPVLMFVDDGLQVYRNGHPEYSEEAPRNDYASCGVRAGFMDMVRVPATAAEVDGFFDAAERSAAGAP